MRFGVVVFPGSNCDYDCYFAIKQWVSSSVEFIWHKSTRLNTYDCIVLPGGFSYGDYLRTGAIARFSPVMDNVIKYAENGGLVIGICNGFQILLESGLLPGAMLRNTSLRFVCKYITLRTVTTRTPFTASLKKGEVLSVPIAHNEGNYYIDEKGLEELQKNSQIVFQYCDADGAVSDSSNPNGSLLNIAGICSKRGNILGMMPHPERCCDPLLGSIDGLKIFQSIIESFKKMQTA